MPPACLEQYVVGRVLTVRSYLILINFRSSVYVTTVLMLVLSFTIKEMKSAGQKTVNF